MTLLVVHKSKRGAIDKPQKALGVDQQGKSSKKRPRRARQEEEQQHTQTLVPFNSWELQRLLASPVPIASSTTSAARSVWAPSAAPPSTSSKVSTTPPRALVSSARHKPSVSTRRAWAAASPYGAVFSPPSTAPWFTSARRKTRGTRSSPAQPPEASLPCVRASPPPDAPPRSADSSSRSSRAPGSCSTSSSARSNRCLLSSMNPCPDTLQPGFRVNPGTNPLRRCLRIRRRNRGLGFSAEIRKRNLNRVGEARPRFWRVLMHHLCPISSTSEIGFGWVKELDLLA